MALAVGGRKGLRGKGWLELQGIAGTPCCLMMVSVEPVQCRKHLVIHTKKNNFDN